MDRVPTSIEGFDELIRGGIPKGSLVLLTGPAGSGKTIFGLQFLYNGAVKHNENCLFLSLEMRKEEVYQQAMEFGWDINSTSGRMHVIFFEELNLLAGEDPLLAVEKYVKENNITRLVLDSITSYVDFFLPTVIKSEPAIAHLDPTVATRYVVHQALGRLKSTGVTALVISEMITDMPGYSRDGVSEFACDSIVILDYLGIGQEYHRSLIVRKMRLTEHDSDVHPMVIDGTGISVKEKTDFYSIK